MPRTPTKTTKARDGWPRYYKSLYNDFAARLDRLEKILSEKRTEAPVVKSPQVAEAKITHVTGGVDPCLVCQRCGDTVSVLVGTWCVDCTERDDKVSAPESAQSPAPPVAKPAGVVTWTKVYGGVFRYVDGKCVQGWDTDGLRCDYTTQPARFSSETDITYAEALKNPGVARDYPPPVEPQAEPVKPPAPDLEAMAMEWAEKCLQWEAGHVMIWEGIPGFFHDGDMKAHGQGVPREEFMPMARKRLANLLLSFSRHAESERVRQLEARVMELTARCNRFEDRAKRCAELESKLGLIKDHLTQWNLAKTNAAANQAVSNAFNEVTS